jgi:cysteine desulfuration protein SufE
MPLAILAEAQAIEDEFAARGDWSSQLQLLIEMGRRLPRLPEVARTEDDRVDGCQSQLWVVVWSQGSRLRIEADSDALVMRGVLSLILRLYDDRAPGAALAHLRGSGGLSIVERLAPSRANGLRALISRIEDAASRMQSNAGSEW